MRSTIILFVFLTLFYSYVCYVGLCVPLWFYVFPIFLWIQQSNIPVLHLHLWWFYYLLKCRGPSLLKFLLIISMSGFLWYLGVIIQPPDNSSIYDQILQVEGETNFDHFIGEFQIFFFEFLPLFWVFWAIFYHRVSTFGRPFCRVRMERLDKPRLPK